ncbi:MAG TPA: GreA/GreB family elongation factor [Acidothermaceae bacterium]|nr:GreA/GreB family elongation factor [Acidothermaceae bacterium]
MTIDLTAPELGADADHTGCSLAAVHPDSRRLDAIIARATARAAITQSVVVFLTVANNRPLSKHLPRMWARLATTPHPVRLVATWIDGDSAPRSQRPALIAAEIADAAQRLGAAAVVIGHDPTKEASSASVIGRLAADLTGDIELCLGADAALTTQFPLNPSTQHVSRWHLAGVHLTDPGRRRLAVRARGIERNELPAARRRIRAQAASADALLTYERLLNDYRALTSLIATAPRTAEIPDDPGRVELGEQIELATEDGTRRRLVVVADVEITCARGYAAASSGIGRALLGRRIGDWTLIPTQRGMRRARILTATR